MQHVVKFLFQGQAPVGWKMLSFREKTCMVEIAVLMTSSNHRRSSDKLQFKANGVVFERLQFVIPNKGDWCSAAWAGCPMAA